MSCKLSVPLLAASTALSMTLIGGSALPATAHDGLQAINSALFYPNSSQRFFQEGYDLLEVELQRLQQSTPPTPDVLRVNSEVLQQQQSWQQQLCLEQTRLTEPDCATTSPVQIEPVH